MYHRLSNNVANFLYCFDQMLVGNMGVARSGPAPTGTIPLRTLTWRMVGIMVGLLAAQGALIVGLTVGLLQPLPQ